MHRRTLLKSGVAGLTGSPLAAAIHAPFRFLDGPTPEIASLIPVVGDGKWVWTEPPAETGLLEPRSYEAIFDIQLRGRRGASNLKATTPVPIELPEQTIDDVQVAGVGCKAGLRRLGPTANQLTLFAPSIARGQEVRATARFRLTLRKQYFGFKRDMFPLQQTVSTPIRRTSLNDSPGIQTRDPSVRRLAQKIAGQLDHPWDQAEAFYRWVWSNIEPRIQGYTDVVTALRTRIGDCEERAAIFVAFCRAMNIPARLVWIPNHNWAEFYLVDEAQQGQWIPAHTAAYSWFGWTGAHELVIQKGDRIPIPEKRRPQRLVLDWLQYQGGQPEVIYGAELRPLPDEPDGDPGPGARKKDRQGKWQLVKNHDLDRFVRDGG